MSDSLGGGEGNPTEAQIRLYEKWTDGYGGSIEARCRIVLEVIKEVRRAVGPSFPIGIRINSSDQLEGGLTEEDALEVLRFLDQTSIDLIDISGGIYFPGAKAVFSKNLICLYALK